MKWWLDRVLVSCLSPTLTLACHVWVCDCQIWQCLHLPPSPTNWSNYGSTNSSGITDLKFDKELLILDDMWPFAGASNKLNTERQTDQVTSSILFKRRYLRSNTGTIDRQNAKVVQRVTWTKRVLAWFCTVKDFFYKSTRPQSVQSITDISKLLFTSGLVQLYGSSSLAYLALFGLSPS